MESVYLKQLVDNTPQGGSLDTNAPFSFLEWKERLPFIIEKDALYHYNQYVLTWFYNNKQKPISQKFVLRQKYLYLLDQLQLFFSEKEKNTWYSQINLADEKELLLAIPYFAKKLKDIALYYLKLRRQLKNTKLRYNTVGSVAGLKQEVYNYLLGTFSASNNELGTVQTTVPSFSSLQNSLIVEIEELYDDKQYFDLSPTNPLSGYFDVTHEITSNFFATKGIILSSADWLFQSFDIPVDTNFDSVVSSLTGNIFELSDTALYTEFIQQYLAENKQLLTFTSQVSTTNTIDISIAAGNNYFYYPYGTTDSTVAFEGQLPPVALSSLNIGPATAGSSLEDSDIIAVKTGDEIKRAWLRYKESETYSKTVKASLRKDSSTSFIYPFPGYGLSGDNFLWTGPGFETTGEFDFLSRDLKMLVKQAYWSQTLPVDSCNSILLNNTTLISSGAMASPNPTFADQVYIRSDRSTDTTVPYGELSGAWLYKFTKTSFPVSSNEENVLVWPYSMLNTGDPYPSHLRDIDFVGACNDITVHELPKSYFIAASSIDIADKIYKLDNFEDDATDASECAWLSGAMHDANGYRYIEQDNFSALFTAGEAVRFIWTGPEATLESVFKSTDHRKDCPFVTNVPSVSSLEWQKCTCKQVYHAPFGHSYRYFEEGSGLADFIALDSKENNLEPFDLGSWRDETNLPAVSSLEFAWYKTQTNNSWGGGKWVSNPSLSSTPLTLQPGKTYFYKRANTKIDSSLLPPYIVNYNFGLARTKWIEAKRDSSDTWISTERSSNLILRPGDLIKIERQPLVTSYMLSSYETENISSNKGSVWSVYDNIPVVCGRDNSTILSWPAEPAPFGSTDNQYPVTTLSQITGVNAWKITRLEDNETQTITDINTVTFVPPTTGTYSIAVTATKLDGTLVFESTNIPKISAFEPYAVEYTELEFSTPTSGFLLEHSLRGWNYNTNAIDTKSAGARPYWAVLDFGKNSSTRYKGIFSWGYPDEFIDEYLPVTAPLVSPLEIQYGNTVEYFRKGYSFVWNQPIGYRQFIGSTQWCEISSDVTQPSSLSAVYESKENPEPIVLAKTTPTDILLSNKINGSPVEIFYYALNSFVWPVSYVTTQPVDAPTPVEYFNAGTPWANVSNRFYPTIANVPVAEETYSVEDVGGYFLPQHLGASQFINKDFTVSLKTAELTGSFITENTDVHVGGRGRTKQDQETLYDWSENNYWMKESATTGDLAGAVKKTLTKTFQTFIPYQSNIEDASLGLVTPRSRLSPWGGLNQEQWTDVANQPTSFTGIVNVSAWANTQVLKQNEKTVDQWTSDIYGNQYGLFKQLSGITVAEHIDIPGELWVRTNSQTVSPATKVLSAVFEPFQSVNLTIYDQLTSNGINIIECYYDTLFIECKNAAIFSKIEYDYGAATIKALFDDARYKVLNENLRFEKNWFFSSEKRVISLFTEITGNSFKPALYELDLSSIKFRKIFPTNSINVANVNAGLSSLEFKTLGRGTIHYNNSLGTYLITYTGTDLNDKMFVSDFHIKYEDWLNITKINLYRDLFDPNTVTEPPIVLDSYLEPITIQSGTFTVNVSALNSPTAYSLLNYNTQVSVVTADGFGVFTGSLSAGLHHINYVVSNSIGDSVYCLTIQAL